MKSRRRTIPRRLERRARVENILSSVAHCHHLAQRMTASEFQATRGPGIVWAPLCFVVASSSASLASSSCSPKTPRPNSKTAPQRPVTVHYTGAVFGHNDTKSLPPVLGQISKTTAQILQARVFPDRSPSKYYYTTTTGTTSTTSTVRTSDRVGGFSRAT